MNLLNEIEQALLVQNVDTNKIGELKALAESLGRQQFLKELRQTYISTNESLIQQLRPALQAGSLDKIRQLLHQLKASAGNLGLSRLHQLCLIGELFLRVGGRDCNEFRVLLKHIELEYAATLPKLPEA